MARNLRHHSSSPGTRGLARALVLAGLAWAARARAAEPAEPTVTLTFPAITHDRAKLTVNPDAPDGPATTFKVVVGATTQTFTRATPAQERTIDVPAEARALVRFDVEVAGAPATHAFALITPGARPLLIPDACGVWDLATSGAAATATCAARERHCPEASRPVNDHHLVLSQCGQDGRSKFCVPDYRLDVSGEKGQKLRAGPEGGAGQWLLFRNPHQVRHLYLPAGGRCPGVVVESGSDRARLSIGWGQHVRVVVGLDGQLSAADVAPDARSEGGGGGD